MKDINNIVQTLTLSEKKIITDILRFRYKKNTSKRLTLFQLILQGCCKDDICIKLYGENNADAFSKLCTRLKNDLLDVLLLFPSASKQTPISSKELFCQKLLLQSEILINKGLIEEAIVLLKQINNTASKYEYQSLAISANILLYKYIPNPVHDRKTDYLANITERIPMLEANNSIRASFQEENVSSLMKDGYKADFCWNCASQNMKTSSQNIQFLNHLRELKRMIQRKEYQNACNLGEMLHNKMKVEPAIASNDNLVLLNIEIARAAFYLCQYPVAIDRCKEIVGLPSLSVVSELNSKEILFFAYLRSKRYRKARLVIKSIDRNTYSQCPFLQNRWALYDAGVDFGYGLYKSTLKKLYKGSSNKSQDTSLALVSGYKLLELMSLVELNEFEWLEYRLETFRKFLTNYQLNGRFWAAYHLIHGFIRQKKTEIGKGKMNLLVEQLSEAKESYYWDPMGVELFRIEEWIKEKLLVCYVV